MLQLDNPSGYASGVANAVLHDVLWILGVTMPAPPQPSELSFLLSMKFPQSTPSVLPRLMGKKCIVPFFHLQQQSPNYYLLMIKYCWNKKQKQIRILQLFCHCYIRFQVATGYCVERFLGRKSFPAKSLFIGMPIKIPDFIRNCST